MPDIPLVSIAAISYNTSKFVVQTLDSIKRQTYPNIELVIVDDCSTDNSVEVIDEWLKTYDKPYKFIKHEVNKGVCATYNSGLNNATGKYFTVVDTDDILLPEKTAIQVEMLKAAGEHVGAVYSDAYLMDEESSPKDGLFIQLHRQFSVNPSGNIYEILLQGNYIPCMTLLIKSAVFKDIGGYDESLVYEDYDMWLRIARKYEIIFSDFISCRYRMRQGSLSSTVKNWKLSDAKIFLKHIGAPLPIERLRNIAKDVYTTDDKDTLPYIKELAIKISDRHILTHYLLGKLKIKKEVGTIVYDVIDKGIALGWYSGVNSIDTTDSGLFINNMVSAMPYEFLRPLCRAAYFDNDDVFIAIVQQLATKTKDKYMKTIWLLWKYKIKPQPGGIILDRVDGYINAGKHALYIDLCIYKDIFEAKNV